MIKGSYLAFDGYYLPKNGLTKAQITDIKKHLTAVPKNSGYSDGNEEKSKYKVYRETDEYFIVPRYFGVDNFGQPEKTTFTESKAKIVFTGKMRDYQEVIVEKCLKHLRLHGGGLLSVPCGMGKCLAKGTLVTMYDGSLKQVEDIKVGEQIMGDDSTPRTILSLARGQEEMFDIIPTKGDKYTVNRSHILSLKWGTERLENMNGTKYHKDDIIDISVNDYLKLPKMFNNSRGSPLRGYRVPLIFPAKPVLVDPYFLGLWLGDGTSKAMTITSIDPEIVQYCNKYAEKMGLNFHRVSFEENITYALAKKTRSNKNPIVDEFNRLNLMKNKHIPDIYKHNSEDIRLKVLAGLIDTDGFLLDDKAGFEIIQKNEKLADDIVYLARSLGFACYKAQCINKCTNSKNPDHQGTYYRMTIYGDCDKIPTILPRKKANKRKQIKNVLNYGITVKSIGMGDYFGFEIDGNHRFVLGDFSVTHNTSMAIYMASVLGLKTLVLTHKSFLQDQWVDRIKQFTGSAEKVGIIRQNTVDVEGKDFVIGMIQSIAKRKYDPEIFKDFGCLIIDEAHHYSSKHFSNALYKCGAKYTIALSATPYRQDGLMRVTNWFIGDVMHQQKLKINNQVVSKTITFLSEDELFKEIKQARKTQKNGRWVTEMKPDYVQMVTNLTLVKERNDMIINIIDQLRKDPERKILILSDRIAHLKLLKEETDKKIQESIDAGEILKDECKTYFYIGDLKRKEREEAEDECDILFGSYGMAQEGLDIDRLNTIILSTAKKDVVQSVGRILRKVLQNNDVRPLIIDVSDNLSIFKSQFKARELFYEKSKYIQHYYYYQNGKLISPSNYMDVMKTSSKSASTKVPANFAEVLYVSPVKIEGEVCETNAVEVVEPVCIEEVDNKDTKVESDDEKPKKISKKKTKKEVKVEPENSDSENEKPKKKSKKKKIVEEIKEVKKLGFSDWF